MSNRLVLLMIVYIFAVIALFVFLNGKWEGRLVSPKLDKILSQDLPTPVPSPIIREIKYDSSTDLKEELESVDPKVSDDDFKQNP